MLRLLVTRGRDAIRTGWQLVGVTLLALLLVEGFGRVVFWGRDAIGRLREPKATAGELQAMTPCIREAKALRLRWRSYVYWCGVESHGGCVTVGSDGLRPTWQPAVRDSVAPRIAMFGGSAMWGMGAPDDETIPSLVARRLAEAGEAARVENDAQLGWVSTQSLVELMLQLRADRIPRVAVFCDGWNDICSCFQMAQAGIPQNEFNREAEFNLLQDPGRMRRLALGAPSPTVLGQVAAGIRSKLRRRTLPGAWPQWTRVLGGEPSEAQIDSAAREVVRCYEGNLRVLETLGREYGFHPLFYWQPDLFTKHALTAAEAGSIRGSEQLGRFVRAVHRAIRESRYLREERSFRDLSEMFADRTDAVFLDLCHVGGEANGVLADAMLGDIRRAIASDK